MEQEVEGKTAFLQGFVISWPSSCFSAGTRFILQRAGTNIHAHSHTQGGGGTAAQPMPTCQPSLPEEKLHMEITIRSCKAWILKALFPTAVPYLSPVKSYSGKNGLRDARSLQLLPHTLVDVSWYVCWADRRPSWCLTLQPCGWTSSKATLWLLWGLGIRGFRKYFGRRPSHRRVVEILLWCGWEALAS